MDSLDDRLPFNFTSARTPSSTAKTTGGRTTAAAGDSSSAATDSDEVSTKTIISVSVVLGIFLVASVVGAVVTFVETEAKDASRNSNHSAPNVEFIRFAPNDTLEDQTLDATHGPVVAHGASATSSSPASRNVTSSFGSLLEALAGGRMAGPAVQQA